MRILHLITDLGAGGAETALHKLLASMDLQEFQSEVVSLAGDYPIGERIRALGVPVVALKMRAGRANPRLVTEVRKHILRFHPDLVQTWMYHADLVGGIAAKLSGGPPAVWNIRHMLKRSSDVKRRTLLVARANALLSGWLPEQIICCAEAALESHAALGYMRRKMTVIPNGFDLSAFRPDPDARAEIRAELGLDETTPLIGMCARFDPQKDYENFVRAAGILHRALPQAQFVLWGKGVDCENRLFTSWIAAQGLEKFIHLLGFRTDSARLDAALDLATLSAAYGEAFPNVIGEAMACGVPCVVTTVGDSASIVGESGRAVPPRNSQALAEAWLDLLNLPRPERLELGQAARRRVAERYDIEKVARRYAGLYQDIISRRTRA